jgi:hypothetical protein
MTTTVPMTADIYDLQEKEVTALQCSENALKEEEPKKKEQNKIVICK